MLLPLILSTTRHFSTPQTPKIQSRILNCAMVANDWTALPDFGMEQVSDRRRALDVMVFRGFSKSANEYMQQYKQENDDDSIGTRSNCETHARHDDNGHDTNILGGPVVTFVAISNDAEFARTNGVVAAVDAKLTKDCILVKNLHVNERVRRRGLASALIKAVKDFTTNH